MAPDAASVTDYLASLPPDRRAVLARVRAAVNSRLPPGYEERVQQGMISWVVPASRLSHTYNGFPLPLASLGAQKQHMALYLSCIYGDDALRTWFEAAYRATGKSLDMGKSCLRFASVDDVALDVVGDAIARVPVDAYVASYQANRSPSAKQKPVAASAEKPAKATKSAKATTPAKATAAKATKSAKATTPAKATKSAKATTPAKTVKPAKPAKATKAKAAKAMKTMKAHAAKTTKPAKAMKPAARSSRR